MHSDVEMHFQHCHSSFAACHRVIFDLAESTTGEQLTNGFLRADSVAQQT